MLHLELPHINVLSKVDLVTQYGDLGTVQLPHVDPDETSLLLLRF